jgi:hypothetical protein
MSNREVLKFNGAPVVVALAFAKGKWGEKHLIAFDRAGDEIARVVRAT